MPKATKPVSKPGKAGKKEAKEARYSKSQFLKAGRYADRRDLLSALLDEEKKYSIAEMESIINTFMKEKVK